MKGREIVITKTPEELSSHAARLFARVGRDAMDRFGSFAVALAGGSTPRKLYSLLSSNQYRSGIDWSKVSFFFGDERNVSADSPQSNYRMAKESLLEPLGIVASRVHRWRTELDDPDAIANDYEDKVRRHFAREGRGFDLVLLGLGTDGHTASLFPHTRALHERERYAIANWVDKLGAYRLTETFPAINRAANVLFMVAGTEKAAAVAQVLEGEFRPDEFPAQLVIPENGSLYWLLDRAAGANLKVSS
jgi:6-phosphogluconolactonase